MIFVRSLGFSSDARLGHMCRPSHSSSLDGNPHSYRLQCLRFNGTDFRGLCFKLEQHFEADGVANNAKERFGFSLFRYPMAKLVSLKQCDSVNQFHNEFVSLINQLKLSEAYALCIFTSNLKLEVGQSLQLFKPKSLVEGSLVGRQVDGILCNFQKRNFQVGIGVHSRPLTLFPTTSTMTKAAPTLNSTQPSSGFYSNCAAKYNPNHKCMESQLHQLLLDPYFDGEGDEFRECHEQLEDTE
ncbi:hypothetical protein CXB51_005651 [Gossypium anomalum]|uniref:Uncharacterized protein n=1 Tax=Gossypium anomalum TaxID=47600 RepID=A0A8J5Z2U8_9ROSI|nr:hypothetical protein CXB51_005651 [Gossypium anomalum]